MPSLGVSKDISLDRKSGEGNDDVMVSGVIRLCWGKGIEKFSGDCESLVSMGAS